MCLHIKKAYFQEGCMDGGQARIKGWTRRGIYDDPRLTEILTMYEDLGFAVKLEPFRPELEPGCNECIKQDPAKFRVLYTKKKTMIKKIDSF